MKQSKNPIQTFAPPEMARLLGVSGQTIRRLTQEGILPKVARGEYDPFVAVAAYCAHLRKQASNQPHGPGASRLTTARARLAEAQALRAENRAARERGELISYAQVEAATVTIARETRNMFLGLSSRLGQRIPHLSKTDIVLIDDEVRNVLTTLSRLTPNELKKV